MTPCNYNNWTDLPSFCQFPGPERHFRKRSAMELIWRKEDDSASPRNTDPSVVSQTLPLGVTPTWNLNSVFTNMKSVLSHFDKCVLRGTFSISYIKKCGEFKLALISWIDWRVITLAHIFVWSLFSVTEIYVPTCRDRPEIPLFDE